MNFIRAIVHFLLMGFACADLIYEFLTVDDQTKAFLRKSVDECNEKANKDYPKLIDDIDSEKFVDPEVENCMMECQYHNSGIFNEQGEFIQDQVLKIFDPKYGEMLKKCMSLEASSPCERAYTSYKCVITGVRHF